MEILRLALEKLSTWLSTWMEKGTLDALVCAVLVLLAWTLLIRGGGGGPANKREEEDG